ncbi:MAG: TonB-dependent receptor, partial [Verrucomicrobiae bacterium]|nr:TonB-dependent receptor [Verrucomicrobiae bacterium]
MHKRIILISLLAAAYSNTPLHAQHDRHDEEEIIDLQQLNITASPFALKQEDVVIPTNSVSKSELRRVRQSSLGATLDGQPGIHSSSFAAGAGRPVIRGFDGDRVSILQNGTDTFDVSFTSPDHGVAVEPLLIDRIEVVRGPASLLYGNAAIGGVVNVIDKSLLRGPVEGITGEAELKYGSVSDEKAGGLSLQGGQDGLAWSLNYYKRDADDYDIPGFAESAFQRESEEHEHEGEEEEEEEHEEVYGTLENSFAETETFAIGAGWFSESAAYSLSYNQFDSLYGVPGHTHSHEHEEEGEEEEEHEEHEEGPVVIDLRNRRTAFRAEWMDLGGLFESMELDAGYGDYKHAELEGEPGEQEIGTVFERDGFDLRLSGIHRPMGDWSGALGLDFKDETFKATGEEAFIPANDKQNYALFAVERLETSWGAFEMGGRVEHQSLNPDAFGLADKSETTINLSTGLLWKLEDESTLAANLSLNERAPNAAELFAFGPHAGTSAFEIGDLTLGKESSLSLDTSWRKSVGNLTGEFTLFMSEFQDYIFLEHMDHEAFEALYPDADDGGLDILKAEAVDARFYGFELDLRFHIVDTPEQRFHFDLTLDQTRATNRTEKTNLPRIPTRRLGGRFGYEEGPWNLGLGARYHSKASHLAPEESPTDSYTLVFADINY